MRRRKEREQNGKVQTPACGGSNGVLQGVEKASWRSGYAADCKAADTANDFSALSANTPADKAKTYRERSNTHWACTHHFLGVAFGITIPLPTEDHDEAARLVRTTWPGVRVAGRLLKEIPARAKQKG